MAYGTVYDYLMGQSINAYDYFGAHFVKWGDQEGVVFRLYAPMASDVSIIGDFNNWDMFSHKMNKIDDSGVYELFVPNLYNYQALSFQIRLFCQQHL